MFFFAYLGARPEVSAWDGALQRHASWLGLTPHTRSREIADGRVFSFGWLSSEPPDLSSLASEDAERRLTLLPLPTLCAATTEDLPSWPPPTRGFRTDAVRMRVSLDTGEAEVAVPPLTVQQFYYAHDARGYVFGNDMRLLLRWAGLELDERAVLALFEYDFVPPVLTLSRRVQRVPMGHLLHVPSGAGEPSLHRYFRGHDGLTKGATSASPADRVADTMDDLLAHVPQSTALLFSGGVDSGLIAARLAAIGRKDVALLNFATGPDNTDGQVALKMAAHIGLTCHQLVWNPSSIAPTLEHLATDYSFPFADPATIPTMQLIHALMNEPGSSLVLLDGTGGGSNWQRGSLFHRWNRIYSLPMALRRAKAGPYRRQLWRRDSKLSRLCARMQQSLQMPLALAADAHGTMDRIAYTLPPEMRDELERTFQDYSGSLGSEMTPEDQVSLVSSIRACAALSAAKSFDPLRRRGIRGVYPYLEPAMLDLGFSFSWEQKNADGVSKGLLKQVLARSFPREWVHRAKTGLRLPFSDTFGHPFMRAFVGDIVLSQRNPLLNLCRVSTVRTITERAERGQTLSGPARRFLWSLVFTSGWLSQFSAAPS